MREDVEKLVNNLEGDSELRGKFRSAPHEVAEQHGIELNDLQREHLKSVNWHGVSDEELSARLRGMAKVTML